MSGGLLRSGAIGNFLHLDVLTLIGIPLSYSIADGLALGFISYPLIKLFSGRSREANWLTYVLAAVLVVYFGFVLSKMG